MTDNQTRKLEVGARDGGLPAFLARWHAALVVVSGGAEGTEYELDREKFSLGRGPGVDLEFDDSAMSREHAVIEFAEGGFRIRDLGSTNGTLLNGDEVMSKGLTHRDRLQLGEHVFQFVLEERERRPRTYLIPEE